MIRYALHTELVKPGDDQSLHELSAPGYIRQNSTFWPGLGSLDRVQTVMCVSVGRDGVIIGVYRPTGMPIAVNGGDLTITGLVHLAESQYA